MRPPPLETANTELNMTPMIDIVFQLILFFLFNLRFKSVDFRIEAALPKEGSHEPTPVLLPPTPRVEVRLFRVDAEDADRARTRAKVGGYEWILPAVSASRAERDAAFARVTEAIRALRGDTGMAGSVATPLPSGAFVPHADVVGVVDAFLAAEVHDIAFVGTPAPKP
jgi:biopolymer transport protein ExbD